jgi:hypothetical protein
MEIGESSKSDVAATSDVDDAGRGHPERLTLGTALDRYQKEITARKKGRIEEVSVLGTIRSVISDFLPLSLASIRRVHIIEYCNRRRAMPPKYRLPRSSGVISAATINKELCLLSSLFKAAQRQWGLQEISNPVTYDLRPGYCYAISGRAAAPIGSNRRDSA